MSDPISNLPQRDDDANALAHRPDAPVPVAGRAGETPPQDGNDQLDAANASLAGALAVSFSVLRIVMVLLVAVFLLSGFFTVGADEVAVRTRFGKIISGPEGEVLTPEGGPYFRWPAPIGQVYRIPTANQKLEIADTFVFRAAQRSRGGGDRPLSEASQGPRLDPTYDGALLTADQAIVHARYEVTYRVAPEDAARFVRNLAAVGRLDVQTERELIFESANLLVQNVVEQAIVEDVASTPLERFLRGGRSSDTATTRPAAPADVEPATDDAEPPPGDEPEQPSGDAGADLTQDETDAEGTETTEAAEELLAAPAGDGREDRIRGRAQRALDEMNAGITLVSVTRTEQTVASSIRTLLLNLQHQIAEAASKRNLAETQRNVQLTEAAGAAWRAVLGVIDAYEEAYRLRGAEPERFEQATAALRAMFAGEPLGPLLEGLAEPLPEDNPLRARLLALAEQHPEGRLGGRAGIIVNGAAAEASSYVAALEAEAERFSGYLATYRERPELVRRSLLTSALQNIFSGEETETTFVAPGSDLTIQISRDRQAELEEEARRRERAALRGTGPAGGAPAPRPAGGNNDP